MGKERDVCHDGRTIFTTSVSTRGGKIVRRVLLWQLGCFMFYPIMFYRGEMFNVLLFYPFNNMAVREVTTLALRVFYVLSFE